MMINPINLPLANRSKLTPSTRSLVSPLMLLCIAGFSAVYLLLINVLGKIGLGQTGQNAMVIMIPVAIYLVAGFSTRLSGTEELGEFRQFQQAGGTIGAVGNAMAGAAEWFSLFFIIGIITALSASQYDGVALLFGTFCGFALMAIFIMPKLSRLNATSLASVISCQMREAAVGRAGFSHRKYRILRATIAAVVIFCAAGILIAQIAAGSDILVLYFPMPITWAAIALLAPVALATLAGGMRSLTIANMLAMWLIGAALLLPVTWLSARITGNPIPQWSYGSGALQPILQLEQQLARLGETQAVNGRGNFAEFSGGLGFVATLLCMMAGTVALPILYGRITCSSGIATRTRSIGWILVFVALLASIMPAFVIFINFDIYRDLVGLPVNELEDGIGWLMNWASFGRGNHALVCGSPAYDIQAIAAACGNDPDRLLLPSDLHFSPLMTLLGAGTIADMPSVYSAITFAGLLSASATTAGIAMMVIVNTANDELIFPDNFSSGKNSTSPMPPPIARRLFVSRLLLLVLCVSGIWLAEIIPAPATDFTLWAFGLSAGAIFPVLVMSIWWKPITTLGGLTGVISGFFVTFYLMVSIEFGSDWVAKNGNESVWLLPLSGEPVRSINAAIIGIPIAVITIIAVSIAESHIKNRRQFPNKPGIKANGRN